MPTVLASRAASPAAHLYPAALPPAAAPETLALETFVPRVLTSRKPQTLHWPQPTAAQQRMHDAVLARSGRTSLYPLGAFGLASGGKLLLAIGAGLAVNGAFDHHKGTLNAGIALVVIGFTGAFSAALMFAQDVKTIDYKLGWILKCCSISAAALIGAGYGLRGYGIAKQDITIERCAVLLLAAGLSTMTVTLPWFVTYSEARRGLIPLKPREPIRVGCMAAGAGILFGWAVCASGAAYPVPASQSVLTVAAMLLTLGIALSTSDIVQQAAYGAVSHGGLRVGQRAGAFAHREDDAPGSSLAGLHTA